MTERKRALTDLRATADERLFADWHVTPELKSRLMARIRAAGQRPAPAKARSPWVWRSAAAGLAAVAVVALVMIGGNQGQIGAPENRVQSDAQQPSAAAAAPAPVQPPGSVTGVDQYGTPTVQLHDANGNTVTSSEVMAIKVAPTAADVVIGTNAQLTFTSATADTATPPIAGVEVQPGRKVVLNAEFNFQVTDAGAAMQRLQSLAAASAGYIVDSALNKGDDGSWAGRATLRVPATAYNGAVGQLRSLGEVKAERQWSQDVTDTYYDLQARIAIQQEFEKKLEELAGRAGTFDEWFRLTQQLNNTRADIERMQGSLKRLGNQVDYSTINLTFVQPAPGKVEPPKPPEPAKGVGPAMRRAFGRSIDWFAGLGESLLVGLAAAVPFLIALVIVGVAAVMGWRRWRRQ